MIWVGIIGSFWKLIDDFRIDEDAYIAFIREHIENRLKRKALISGESFMQDNAPSHATHKATECQQAFDFSGS